MASNGEYFEIRKQRRKSYYRSETVINSFGKSTKRRYSAENKLIKVTQRSNEVNVNKTSYESITSKHIVKERNKVPKLQKVTACVAVDYMKSHPNLIIQNGEVIQNPNMSEKSIAIRLKRNLQIQKESRMHSYNNQVANIRNDENASGNSPVMTVELFDKMLMRSKSFQKLSNDQAKLLENQQRIENTLQEILTELRSTRPNRAIGYDVDERINQVVQSHQSTQKRLRRKSIESDLGQIDNSHINRSKRTKTTNYSTENMGESSSRVHLEQVISRSRRKTVDYRLTSEKESKKVTSKHIANRRKTVDCRLTSKDLQKEPKKREEHQRLLTKKIHSKEQSKHSVSRRKTIDCNLFLKERRKDNDDEQRTCSNLQIKSIRRRKTIDYRRSSKNIGRDDVRKQNPNFKNIDKTLHYNNPDTRLCGICNKWYERIVTHYKIYHSEEEIIASRLPPNMADEIQRKPPKVVVFMNGPNKFVRAKCPFCDEEKQFSVFYWSNHIDSHTGEYRNKCRVCSTTFAFSTVHCELKTTRTDAFRLDEEDITAHLCLDCNFVQIDKKNMIRHLKTQHEYDDAVLMTRFKLITLLSTKNQQNHSNDEVSLNSYAALKTLSCQAQPIAGKNGFQGWSLEHDRSNTVTNRHTQCSSPTNHWRIKNVTEKDPLQREKLTAVMPHYFQTTTYQFKVKEWIDNYWTKPANENGQLSPISQFALFKCMHPQCIFSTNTEDDMAIHMESHAAFLDILNQSTSILMNPKIRDEQIKFRDCSYCDLEASSNHELIEHIVSDHGESIYQCKFCFYRAVEVGHIVMHYELFHPSKSREIYMCGEIGGERHAFREEDKEMLLTDCKNNVETIKCGQFTNNCLKEFMTFNDLYEHFDNSHPDMSTFQCKHCNENLPLKGIELHLNAHNFWEFHCIYCKSFGQNDIHALRKHLSVRHSSKFSFIAARNTKLGVKSLANSLNFTLVYIGNSLIDHTAYKFFNLPKGIDLSCMDPSLLAFESHKYQQNSVSSEMRLFARKLPEINFDGISDNYMTYEEYFSYACIQNGCNFRTVREENLMKHLILGAHSKTSIGYKILERISNTEKVIKMITCRFECNICNKQFDIKKDINTHFKAKHPINLIDSKLIQNIKMTRLIDGKKPVESVQVVSGQYQYSDIYFYLKDNTYANSKCQLIAHHRSQSMDYIEFKFLKMVYKRSGFGWNEHHLTEENTKFDRMFVYECNQCSCEKIHKQVLFASIEEVKTHYQQTHSNMACAYILRQLFACAHCKTVSTLDGLIEHCSRFHPENVLALLNPANRSLCGICNTQIYGIERIIKHYETEHRMGAIDRLNNRLLDKFNIKLDGAHFSPECCAPIGFDAMSKTLKHFIGCPKIDPDVNIYNVKELFSEMKIIFQNGAVVKYKSIEDTIISEEIKHLLEIEIKNLKK